MPSEMDMGFFWHRCMDLSAVLSELLTRDLLLSQRTSNSEGDYSKTNGESERGEEMIRFFLIYTSTKTSRR